MAVQRALMVVYYLYPLLRICNCDTVPPEGGKSLRFATMKVIRTIRTHRLYNSATAAQQFIAYLGLAHDAILRNMLLTTK